MSIDQAQKLQEAVRRVFLEDLNLEISEPELDLLEAGIIDSLALVGLIAGLEERWGVSVDFDTLDLEDLRSLETISALLARLISNDEEQRSAF
jgi:D-alanine--poly(phosphoribitol) ligase subunit 2